MIVLRLGRRHFLVRWIERYERWIGRRADVNLFVSSHMQVLLATRYGLHGTVLRDRPAAMFTALGDGDRRQARARLFAEKSGSRDRALLISATSWTADENLDLFLDALTQYDGLAQADQGPDGLPPVLAVITGRGSLRGAFEERVARTPLACVEIRTAWLEPDEYPRALAAADLGMCFHTSASGVDLPMKIADMFGVGLPVCAYDYGPCLLEVVRPGVNGVVFRSADDCRAHLTRLLRGFPGPNTGLAALSRGVREAVPMTWEVGWTVDARSALLPSRITPPDREPNDPTALIDRPGARRE
jgi:beta-1,4-mannosyltransferase